jgi:pimeloyl-ACP methyl ester carboxylesterase
MRSIRLSHGFDIRFHDLAGDGTPLVFIHGLGCASSSDFVAVARAPALRGRRVLLVDLPGYGFSDKPNSFRYGVDAQAAAICELLDLLNIGQADLFGHSMGGAIAITACAHRPDLSRGLILAEPNLDVGGGVFSRAIASRSEQDYVSSGHAAEIRDAAASGYCAWAGSMSVALPLAVHRDAVSLVEGADPSWRAQLQGLTSLPRTAIFGERSLPDDDHKRLPEFGIAVDVVPAAGHSMAIDNPEGLAIAISSACGA